MGTLQQEVDLKARLCVMASMLYYGLDVTMMHDSEYDKLATFVSKHWGLLDQFRQWQVGTAQEIAASGFQCKVTVLAADACLVWMAQHKLHIPGPLCISRQWRVDPEQDVRYLNTNEFLWRSK